MIKTQVQIPDELYRELKRVAAEKEWSFAEVVRRGAEYITQIHPPARQLSNQPWKLPPPRDCGPFLLPEEEWTAACHD